MLNNLTSKILGLVYYAGFALVAIMFVQARISANNAGEAVTNSVQQQEYTRNLIWLNLLMQRSLNLATVALNESDSEQLERAKSIAESMSDYAPTGSSNEDIGTSVAEFQTAVRTLSIKNSASKKSYAQLLSTTDRIGKKLNKIETETWYELEDHNQKVVVEIRKGYRTLLGIVLLFFGYLGFLGWILRRKRIAEAALVDVEAKSLNTAKMSALGEMAGGIAHEINTPLATIMMTSEQAIECLSEEPMDPVLPIEMLKTINTTAGRIAVIIKGLRTFSRDGSRDQFTVYPLKQIIDDVKQLCSERFHHHDVRLEVDPVPDDYLLNCQPIQLSQVLLNLLNNAFDAIHGIEDKWIKISIEAAEASFRIAVIDCGHGIPADVLAKMFQPFFTTKEIGKGTGIGLSISKGIVEAHKGTLKVDSTHPNTCFVVTLPRTEAGQKAA